VKIKFAEGLSFPIDAATQTFGILARKGAGKTYAGMKLAEGFAESGLPFVVLDPLGVWWGLRANHDGKKPGIPVVVIGGAHGDLPIEETAGRILAEFVSSGTSMVILDLSDLRKAAMVRFATEFCEELFEQANRNRRPLHLFVDEAQTFAPQFIDPRKAQLLGAMEDLVCKGRSRGLGITMMSQRPSMVNKNLLSQVEVLVAMQTSGRHDRKALLEWVDANGTPDEAGKLFNSLAKLHIGEAWIWSPSWLRHLAKHKILKKWTFDSSRTPKVGETKREPKRLAKVDLEALRGQMTETVERAKAKDPTEMKRRIVKMQSENGRLTAKVDQLTTKIESLLKIKPVSPKGKTVSEAQIKRIEKVVSRTEKISEQIRSLCGSGFKATDGLQKAAADLLQSTAVPKVQAIPVAVQKPWVPRTTTPMPPPKLQSNGDDSHRLGKGETAILKVIAQSPDGATREQITVMTGYKRSSRDTYLQRLTQASHVIRRGDSLCPTDAGISALGTDYEPLPTGEALRRHWLDRLPSGEKAILDILIKAYPNALERDAISESTDYKRSSRDTYLQRLSARKLIISEGRGLVRASDILFTEA